MTYMLKSIIATATLVLATTASADAANRAQHKVVPVELPQRVGVLSAGRMQPLVLDIPAGQSNIEVHGNNNAVISCAFFEANGGRIQVLQRKVPSCRAKVNLDLPATVRLAVRNDSGHDLPYVIRVSNIPVLP